MKYSLLVAAREFGEHVKTKGFWIGILMLPILLTASFEVPRLLDKYAKPTRYFCVIDSGGKFDHIVDESVQAHYDRHNGAAMNEFLEKKQKDPTLGDYKPLPPFFQRVPVPAAIEARDPQSMRKDLLPYLRGDKKIEVDGKPAELFALVILPKFELGLNREVQFWSVNQADSDLADVVENGIAKELKNREFAEKGVTAKEIERIQKLEVNLAKRDPKKAEGQEEVGKAEQIRQLAPIGFVYMLFSAIMTVAQMLLGSTIEEKSNRIVEVLLSSVTPWELMVGKLLGVAAVGLTMLAAWILAVFAVLGFYKAQGNEIASIFMGLLVGPKLLLPFLAFFLLGYLLYASILLALGSTCNTLKDAQNFMGPVVMILMVPLMTMVFVARDPNGPLARILTWVPMFTPFTMMNRMGGDPPLVDLVGSLVLLCVTLIFVIWIAGRIFRNGILRTGQPPKLMEFLKLAKS